MTELLKGAGAFVCGDKTPLDLRGRTQKRHQEPAVIPRFQPSQGTPVWGPGTSDSGHHPIYQLERAKGSSRPRPEQLPGPAGLHIPLHQGNNFLFRQTTVPSSFAPQRARGTLYDFSWEGRRTMVYGRNGKF